MRTHRRIAPVALGAIVMLLTASCSSGSVVGPRDVARLNVAEARWQARPFADYTYEIRTSCFCIIEVVQWVRVTVRDGVVIAAEPVEQDGWPITDISPWEPIESLFATLRTAMTSRSPGSGGSVAAEFDATLGFPVSIDYRTDPSIADGDRFHELRNVAAYPGS